MHTPVLRLVSLHPYLCTKLAFARVPEIEDDFLWRVFMTRDMTVQEVLDGVAEELGLAKAIYGPGGGMLEYSLEEVWLDESGTECESPCDLLGYSHDCSNASARARRRVFVDS